MMAMQISPTFRMDKALQLFASRYPDDIQDMKQAVATEWFTTNDVLMDPWNQDARDETREYLINWFGRLIEDRPELYRHIKSLINKFREVLS
jgi:hypothetical protein